MVKQQGKYKMKNKEIVKAEKPIKKIAIVGTAPSSREKAPYGDETWEIWSLGQNAAIIPRFTRWFELHTERVLREAQAWDGLSPYLSRMGDKLTVFFPNEAYPQAKQYPIEEVKARFGKYFTSSISYMIALALHEGATHIGLWGVDMIGDGEYGMQRSCCEYFLGMARGMGVTIALADECPLLRAERMYALEYNEMSAEIARMSFEIEGAIEASRKEAEAADRKLSFNNGQQAMLMNFSRRFG